MPFNKVPVADRFVHSSQDVWGKRKTVATGFLIHMAEGFNVWAYLAGDNVARGVSVHFTVERDGEIVQMLELDTVSGSVNPDTIRLDNDDNGMYGFTHNKFVLGNWWNNPNHAIITVEVGGFAEDGPNEEQVSSLVKLFDYLKNRYPGIVPLAHRDMQNVKPCPGITMYRTGFKAMGGHGKDYKVIPDQETGDGMIIATFNRESAKIVTLPSGTGIFEHAGDKDPLWNLVNEQTVDYFGFVKGQAGWSAVELNIPKRFFADDTTKPGIVYIRKDVTPVDKPPTDDPRIAELQKKIEKLQDKIVKVASSVTSAGIAVDNASELIQKAEQDIA